MPAVSMHRCATLGTIQLEGKSRSLALLTASGIVVTALLISAAMFIADRLRDAAIHVLDDPQTEHADVVDISVDTLPSYGRSVAILNRSLAIDPLSADGERAMAELLFHLALWRDAMREMKIAVPDVLEDLGDLRTASLKHIKRAVDLDPSNAVQQVVLGRMYADSGERERARESLLRAVSLYPVNSEVRFAVAMEFLLMGMNEDALVQAKLLVAFDDSYRLDEDDPRTAQMREQRTPAYEMKIVSSYLYKALEIIWRISNKDQDQIRSVIPDNIDAHMVERMFLDQRISPGEN